MKDRIPTKVLANGAIRYGVYDDAGTLLRYEYIKLEDAPTEEGTPLCKATLLPDEVCQLLELTTDSVPSDVFVAMILGTKNCGFKFQVAYPNGMPARNLTIQGVTSLTGGLCVTDDKGIAIGVSGTTQVSISIDMSAYIDAQNLTKTVTGILGKIAVVPLVVQYSPNEVILTNSRQVRFTDTVSAIDICCVGAGGGGGCTGVDLSSNYYGGGGGGGGYVTNLFNQLVTPGTVYTATIGSGGSGGSSNRANGSSGGTSSFMSCYAGGGSGGSVAQSPQKGGEGGSGNGAGGKGYGYGNAGSVGADGATRAFNEPQGALYGGGGGGGGMPYITEGIYGYSGGKPNGGRGGYSGYNGDCGVSGGYGGGGGGAGGPNAPTYPNAIISGSAGGQGLIILRIKSRYAS